jgi:hypothetical protein
MKLKPSKCNLVLLNQVDCSFEDGIRETNYIKDSLLTHIPDWSDFVVDLCAKYLGFYMGPKSSEKLWAVPFAKWARSAREYACSHMNATLSAITYNSRAVTILGFVGQLQPLPPSNAKNVPPSTTSCTYPQIHGTGICFHI